VIEWDAIQPGEMQGVYTFFVRGTDTCLYVGESSNLISRINGHYNNSKTSDLSGLIRRDDDPPDGPDELRYVTEVRIDSLPFLLQRLRMGTDRVFSRSVIRTDSQAAPAMCM
jgi:hypothetical protein